MTYTKKPGIITDIYIGIAQTTMEEGDEE